MKTSRPKAHTRTRKGGRQDKTSSKQKSNDVDNLDLSDLEEEYVDTTDKEDEEYDAPQHKKRKRKAPTQSTSAAAGIKKKAKKKSGKKQGPLSGPLSEMPFDVLLEIFSWLGPTELLSLGRTSSSLRELMKSSDLEPTWRNALSCAGLPECPSSMTYPGFTELAYGKGCLACGKTSGNIYHVWEAKTRICTQCVHSGYYQRHSVQMPHHMPPEFMQEYIPHVVIRHRYLYSREYTSRWRTEHSGVCELGSKAISSWQKEKTRELAEMKAHADKCRSWYTAFLREAALKHEAEVKQRQERCLCLMFLVCALVHVFYVKTRVVEIIKELGWEDELSQTLVGSLPQNRSDIQKICQSKLTDHVVMNLKTKLPVIMQELKDERQHREYEAARRARMQNLETEYEQALKTYWPAEKFRPHVADILCVPRILDMVNLPADVEDVQFEFGKGLEALTIVIEEANAIIDQKVLSLMPHHREGVQVNKSIQSEPLNPLALATTLLVNLDVHSHSSKSFYTVAQVVESREARMCKETPAKWHENHPDFDLVAYDTLKCGSWNVNGMMKLHQKAHAAAASILVDVFGFDPLTTTTETMEELNPIVECLECNSMSRGRLMLTWTALIEHHIDDFKHSTPLNTNRSCAEYRLLTDNKELSEVRSRMKENVMQKYYNKRSKFVCMHCGRVDSIDSLRGHMNVNISRRRRHEVGV
ncbi:hypothetical protein BJ165DRAFT_350719 [Panaeolus papilionaceus]|nr:hypothetical protein BJ165DRAFT_350719 [Panaeolus papilionaceus]